MSIIRDMFRASPFEPLRYQMKTVKECVSFVRPMFAAVRDGKHSARSPGPMLHPAQLTGLPPAPQRGFKHDRFLPPVAHLSGGLRA